MSIDDINFRFIGFWNSDGRCHIRIARRIGYTPVIVCSQYANYYGTSVTNAIETIARTLFERIARNDIAPDLTRTIQYADEDRGVLDRIFGRDAQRRNINMARTFRNFIWIEHYPASADYFREQTYIIATMNDGGHPEWHGRPSEEWISRNTGFQLDELLPPAEMLDLASITAPITLSEITERGLDGSEPIRRQWIPQILAELPARLLVNTFDTGIHNANNTDEKVIQNEISSILCRILPASELLHPEFKFSAIIDPEHTGPQKQCDFAIAKPSGDPFAFIEVKRTRKNAAGFVKDIANDICRLAILSHHFKCTGYMMLWGNPDRINDATAAMQKCISTADNTSIAFSICGNFFGAEYGQMLNDNEIQFAHSMLQGCSFERGSAIYIWEISCDKKQLSYQKPYMFRLMNAD